jgi:hypothetical protein
MPEQEDSRVIGVEVVHPLPIEQYVNIRDENREVLIRHNIYPIGSGPFLSQFEDEVEGLDEYHMYGSVIGYPNTASVANIPEGFKDSEDRFRLNCFAEEQFFEQYFDSITDKSCYLRYIHDFVFDGWYERNLTGMVERLKERGIPVKLVLEGVTSVGVYHAVLLFKDRFSN